MEAVGEIMESFCDNDNLNDKEGSCCCCLRDTNLFSLLLPYNCRGKTEVYSNFIHLCFGIQIVAEDDDFKNNAYLICNICIIRLKDALSLRLQVEAARNFFCENLASSRSSIIKTKISNQSSFPINNFKEMPNNETIDHNSADVDDAESYIISNNYNGKFIIDLNSVKIEQNTMEQENVTCNIQRKSTVKFSTIDNEKQDDENSKLNEIIEKKKVKRINAGRKCNPDFMITRAKQPSHKIRARDMTYTAYFGLNENDRTCKLCNETFHFHHTLLSHMTVHCDQVTCHVCAKSFLSQKQLNVHLNMHQNAKIVCKICKKLYKSEAVLQNHIKISHSSKLLNICPLCPKRFKYYYMKITHMIEVHNFVRPKYICKICPQQYSSKYRLDLHVKKCHLSERNCKPHIRTHTGEKMLCDFCNKAYSSRTHLKRHITLCNKKKSKAETN